MRIALAVKNEGIASMDDAENAIIFENGKIGGKLDLQTVKNHAGLNKLMQIVPTNINALVTEHCGPPGIRLAERYSIKIYRATGKFEDIVNGIEKGSLLPVGPDDIGHHDHLHDGHHKN